jgi:hypothetical protein
MFAIFVCFVALIAKVLFLFLSWSVSYSILQAENYYKEDFTNAEFHGHETIEGSRGDCPSCRG